MEKQPSNKPESTIDNVDQPQSASGNRPEGEVPLAERPKPDFDTLPPAAQRAIKEAEARRKQKDARDRDKPKEVGGPKGAEPTRYGDWEKNGRAYDFS